MNLNSRCAFSLIELMIVIAIISILAAIGVPAYKDYAIRSKIQSVVSAINQIKEMQMVQYGKKGAYTHAAGLGITTVSNNYTVANPKNYSQYLSGMYINQACSSTGAEITLVFDNTTIGYSGSEALTLTYLVRITSDGNRHITQCVYRTDGTTQTAVQASKYFPANCQTPLGNPTLVACPSVSG